MASSDTPLTAALACLSQLPSPLVTDLGSGSVSQSVFHSPSCTAVHRAPALVAGADVAIDGHDARINYVHICIPSQTDSNRQSGVNS